MSLESAIEKYVAQRDAERPQKWSPDISHVLEFVDLSVSISPVLPPDCAFPCQVTECENGTFMVYDYANHSHPNDGRHSWGVSREEIRKWRARYLVTRDEIWRTVICDDYSNFPDLARHSTRCRVLPAFGIEFVPTGGVKEMLAKNLGMRHADGSIEVEAQPA